MTAKCSDCALSILIHAESKAGKSTLSSTVPLPAIVLDAEGSWRFITESGFQSGIELRRKIWDPLKDDLPEYDGTWNVCMVSVLKWETLAVTLDRLMQTKHPFRSLVLDSISEAQRKLKRNIKPDSMLDDIRQWNALLVKMDTLIRGYRDLIMIPDTSLQCVVFIAETHHKNNKWRPYLQGQIATQLPYWVDIEGYLYTDKEDEADGTTKSKRVNRLLIEPHPSFETGERIQGKLPGVITNPRIDSMLTTIFSQD